MSAEPPDRPLLLLDACSLINLLATERIEEILGCLPYRCATSRLIASKEVLSIAVDGPATELLRREVIPPYRLDRIATLALLDLETDEEIAGFVRFAMQLDDGEASVCALAVARGGEVATDDRKALRILANLTPPVPTLQTPELLYEWAERMKVSEGDRHSVLRQVYRCGRFFPRDGAPRLAWWETYFRR